MPRTYNPDCDYCENCSQHGHEAEDCTQPLSEEFEALMTARDLQRQMLKQEKRALRWIVLLVAIIVSIVLIVLYIQR